MSDYSDLDKSVLTRSETYTSTTASTAATATATATAAGRSAATGVVVAIGALTTAAGALAVSLGLASELDRDLAVKNGLAVEIGDGALGLRGSGEVDEGVANRTGGAGVGRDGGGLALEVLARGHVRVEEATYTK